MDPRHWHALMRPKAFFCFCVCLWALRRTLGLNYFWTLLCFVGKLDTIAPLLPTLLYSIALKKRCWELEESKLMEQKKLHSPLGWSGLWRRKNLDTCHIVLDCYWTPNIANREQCVHFRKSQNCENNSTLLSMQIPNIEHTTSRP